MENKREFPEITPSTQLSRQYLLAFGSIAHYLGRIGEFQESQTGADPLPPRWMHLAERSLLHRPILRYHEYFNPAEFMHPDYSADAKSRIETLDQMVEQVNSLLQQDGIIRSLKEKGSADLQKLKDCFEKVKVTLRAAN